MICSDNDDSVGCEESWTNISVLISDQRIETFEIDQKYLEKEKWAHSGIEFSF